MTLAEFMDKLNELYLGNERDFGNRNVMVATDGTARPFSELVMYPGELVLCDKASAEEDQVVFEHSFVDKDGNEIMRVKEGGVQ